MATTTRYFSTSVFIRAQDESTPTRAEDAASGGGVAQDAFSKREKASEDLYVRQQEIAKLKALREKLEAQRTNIGDLIKNIDDMSEEGEKKK